MHIKSLSIETLCLIVQLFFSILFIKFFISSFGISLYGEYLVSIAFFALLSIIDIPLVLRFAKKVSIGNKNLNYRPLKYIYIFKLINTFSVFVGLILFGNSGILICTNAFIITICVYLMGSLQIYFNTLNFPRLGSAVLLVFPSINLTCMLSAYIIDFNFVNFLLLSIFLNLLTTILAGHFLYKNMSINIFKLCNYRTLIKFLRYYLVYSFSLLLIRFKSLIRQNAPILIINSVSGPDLAGVFGIVTKLIVIANSITAKLVFLTLPRLIQSMDVKSRYHEGRAEVQRVILKIMAVLSPLTLLFSITFLDHILILFYDNWPVSRLNEYLIGFILVATFFNSLNGSLLLTSGSARRLMYYLLGLEIFLMLVIAIVHIAGYYLLSSTLIVVLLFYVFENIVVFQNLYDLKKTH